MTISVKSLALAMYKARFSSYFSQAYEAQFSTWEEIKSKISTNLKDYESFLASPLSVAALQENAQTSGIDPQTLYDVLEGTSWELDCGMPMIDYEALPTDWPHQLYTTLVTLNEAHKVYLIEPTDEANSLAVYLNQKTDDYVNALNNIKQEYESLEGHFNQKYSTTFSTDSGYWMSLFRNGLYDFLGIAYKNEFNVEELTVEKFKTLGSERYRLKIEGLTAPEDKPRANFADAFTDDVKNFSRDGTYAHTIGNGKAALYVTLQNLGNDESLLYKNGQSQYWRLGSLITI